MTGINSVGNTGGSLPDYNAKKSEEGEPKKASAPQKKVVKTPPEDTMNPIDTVEISEETQRLYADLMGDLLERNNTYTPPINPAAVEQVARQEEEERKKREKKKDK
jgi:hypothetical protein